MRFKSTAATLAALGAAVLAGPLHAGEAGPYAGVGVGGLHAPSTTVTDTTSRSVDFDRGYVGALSLGYDFGNSWRAEGELSRRHAGLDSVSSTSASGNMDATSLMGNVLYDFDINAPVRPYLGLGLGFTRVNLDNAAPFGASSIDDSDTALAGQAIAGLSYAVQDGVDLFADYRYFTTQDLDMRTVAGTAASFDVDTHTVMVGLRFSFGAPKPRPQPEPVAAPMPAPEPAPAPEPKPAPQLPRSYLVFFDWDKSDIKPEAAAIIKTAAANANTLGLVRLMLTGHADRSGPEAYNMRLSQRRADAVKAMFKSLGFEDQEISTVAKGETDPLVPTDDGVREPQNRRVEIVLP